MRTLFILLLLCFLSFSSFAHESYPEMSDWEVISKVKDSTLKKDRTRITFILSGINLSKGTEKLVWSANKYIDTTLISLDKTLSKVFISGKYNFKFYVSNKYREIIIPKLILDSGYSITVQLNFKSSERENMMVKKPVIYLYPETKTDVEIEVKPKGDLTFAYPEYQHGWKIQAHPNGELTLNNNKYNYLFWESKQEFKHDDFDLSRGFIVGKDETVQFLEEKLTAFGLNSKEKADFITFWGPELIQNSNNFIHFIFNEECDQFAELSISPKPENVFRIYILFSEVKDTEFIEILPQEIPQLTRNGFTIIEWGGSEILNYEL